MRKASKLNKLMLRSFFFALIGIGLIGCKKENISLQPYMNQNNTLKNGNIRIPYFSNFEELDNTIEFLELQTEEDRINYEIHNNYTSLLTAIFSIYEGIDTSNIRNVSEIETYVNYHNDKLALKVDDDNEMLYYPYYSENRYSIVANEDRLLQVGNMFMKVFDDGIALTTVEYINELQKVNEISVKKIMSNSNDNIVFYSYEDDEIIIKSACGSAKSFEERNTKGKYRTKLKIKAGNEITSLTFSEKEGLKITYRVYSYGRIRGYKKFLGIWFYTKKQITGKVNYQVKYLRGTTETITVNENVNQNSFSQKRWKNEVGNYSMPATNIRFEYIDSWGKIPQTNKAQKICN